MTDTKLLPSSVAAFTEALKGERGSLDAWLEVNDEREVAAHVEAYTRANVAHATAEKDAEIEALRAEVNAWVKQAQKESDRAERMAEALRDLEICANTVDGCYTRNPGNFAVALRELRESAERSRAALRDHDQGVGNG